MEPISFVEWLFDQGLTASMYNELSRDEQQKFYDDYCEFVLSLSEDF